ncbi:MAG: hypothetical protein OXH57_05185 [Ekhidna sp.]|nr:hypothetical protein [Ekhidna sp.]
MKSNAWHYYEFFTNNFSTIIRVFFNSLIIIFSHSLNSQVLSSGLQFHDKLNDTTTIAFYKLTRSANEVFEWTDLNSAISFNSAYPRGYNDGPVWKGEGTTVEIHGGVAGKVGKFSYQLLPVLYFSQNNSFDLAPESQSSSSPFNYQFTSGIDWIQRYGNSSGLYLHPGQSEIKFQNRKLIAAVSTQNYSFGPSTFNPILLSQQGPGFPHLRIGSDPFPIGKKIGKLEINFLAGLLRESDYFDNITANDNRYFNAFFMGYSPAFLKNLKVGLGRVLYKQTRYFEPEDLLSTIAVLESNEREGLTTGNDTFDQMASMFIDWSFPAVGFRAYAEFAKNDFTGTTRGTLVEPEHARGYTIGFQKELITQSGGKINIIYEHTNLSRNQAWLWRATPSFYSHGVNRQGYTQNGQLIGAGIGPGGNSDQLMVKLNNEKEQSIGFLFQRIENNRDYFVTSVQDFGKHDIEYSFGFSLIKKLQSFTLFSEITLSHNFNRYYLEDATNLALLLGTSIDL